MIPSKILQNLSKEMMKLYYTPGTCALACWIALEWVGAEFEVIKVDPKSDSYKEINPLGMVPALAIDEKKQPLTQADAILQYISERFSTQSTNLGAKNDIHQRFLFNETMAFLTGDFHPAFWPHFTPQRFTTDNSDKALEAVQLSAQSRINRVMNHLDSLIGSTSNHVYGNHKSVADPYAFVMARWSEKQPQSWRAYPNVARFMNSMQDDPVVSRVLALSNKL
jgi:glutathione S-transferase